MKTRLLITVFALALTVPAAAQFRTIQLAHEIMPNDIRLPQYELGTLAFRSCSECRYTVKRVSADTRWIFNGRTLRFEDFRAELDAVEDVDRLSLTVLHHLEWDRITEVSATVH